MGRPRYTITAKDIIFARDYLMNALQGIDYDVRHGGKCDFKRYLESMDLKEEDLEDDARMLNRWCEKCLNKGQWRFLKITILQKRHLQDNKKVDVKLTKNAHSNLERIRDSSNSKSLSQAILKMVTFYDQHHD